ncbi:hypothetical protein BDU57DRAFT_533363 [Ampelomyces quisqualis]|uniref:Uncharacterized protein n=1 Tax=Ampelomyces quisqualis TaxID=50730 RepID=A0A6A5Q724_AMPQU|nr:hypothetical protein BDU57DRAFT_533363 [Ampelomyces quisqualis]
MWKQCIKEQSATYSKENFGLSVNHLGLNKYTSKEDGNYKKILSKLLDIVTPIISQKQHQLYSVPITSTTLTRIEHRHAGLRPGFLLAFLARFHSDGVQEEVLRLASLGLSTVIQELYGGTAELPIWLANILKLLDPRARD